MDPAQVQGDPLHIVTALTQTTTPQVGILGGTFDPPHFGHINLAMSLMEAHGLEEVWFCPAWSNPFKQGQKTSSCEHRLEMTRLAIEGIPQFRVVDIECSKQTVSYTVETLRDLVTLEKQRPQPRQLRLLLGADTAEQLAAWRAPEEIISLAPPIVGCRFGWTGLPNGTATPALLQAVQKGLTTIPLLDISSTDIRYRLSKRLYCGHLIHLKVVDYIWQHHLYSTLLDGSS